MSELIEHQKKLQTLSDLVHLALGVEVFFLDQQRLALAGTGLYRTNIGKKRPKLPCLDMTLNYGNSFVATHPRYTKQCYHCEYRHLCPYFITICQPLAEGSRIKGIIGFLGFSEEQRRIIIERSSLLAHLAKKLDYIWEAEDFDLNNFLFSAGTRRFLDSFDEGIAMINTNQDIFAMNQRAELMIASGRVDLPSKPDLSFLNSKVHPNIAYHSRDYIIRDGDHPLGQLLVISEPKKAGRFWYGCSLDLPAVTTIVGTSPALIALKEQATYIAQSDSTILLIGETGVGKEQVARFIHKTGPRWSGPFETINCAAIPELLFESEMFGYAPGAFTDASRKGRPGKFQVANKGTIFLDEVGRLSLPNQTKILRVLEERQVQRLGDNIKTDIDIRVIAATNIDLEKAVKENQFLVDLYYRLMVIPLIIPPLRERPEDITLLIEYFTLQMCESIPKHNFRGFSENTLDYLKKYSWPGNIRELKNMVEYVVNLVRGRPVDISDLSLAIRNSVTDVYSSEECLAQMELEKIGQALNRFGHDTKGKKLAAKALGISLSTLYRRLA